MDEYSPIVHETYFLKLTLIIYKVEIISDFEKLNIISLLYKRPDVSLD